MAVHAADAVGDRVEQYLLLPVEFLGPAVLVGARQHLAQRGRHRLHGRYGLAVFAEMKMAIKLQNGQHLVADADRHRPAGDHLLAQGRLDARAGGNGSQVGNPDRAATLPNAARQVDAAGQREPHALLDQCFGTMAWSAPGRRELKPVLIGVDIPFNGHIPALGDAEGFENAHDRNLVGRILAHDLAHHKLQGKTVFALLLLGCVAQQAAHR